MESCGCLEEASKALSLEEARKAGHKYPGLPGPLPKGEYIVWQGIPDWVNLAQQTFHIGFVATYFAALAIWRVFTVFDAGGSLGDAIFNAGLLIMAGGVTLALLCLISWVMAQSTIYTITNKRLVLRFGEAFPKSIDIPFKTVVAVALKRKSKGRGNISISLKAGNRAPYFVLWPHVRPFRLKSPEPMLRALPDVDSVADVLGEHLRAAARDEVVASDTRAQMEVPPTQGPSVTDEPRGTPNQQPIPVQRDYKPAYAIVALLVFTVTAVAIFQASEGNRAASRGVHHTVYDLRFADAGSERLAIVSARDQNGLSVGEQIAIVEPGKDGTIRGAFKGLTRIRDARRLDPAESFQLIVWDTGRLTLSDLETDRHYSLDAFGRAGSGAINDLRRLRTEALAATKNERIATDADKAKTAMAKADGSGR